MVSKDFLHYSLHEVYKKVLNEDTSTTPRLADEVRRLAVDESIFTPEEIEANKRQLEEIEYASTHNTLTCYIDGGVKQEDDKAKAAVAFSVYNADTLLFEQATGIPIECEGSLIHSHAAEYEALLHCMDVLAAAHPSLKDLTLLVYTDSSNLVNQLNMRHRTRSPLLRVLQNRAQEQMKAFKDVQVNHIPREENTHVDKLVTDKLDTIPFISV